MMDWSTRYLSGYSLNNTKILNKHLIPYQVLNFAKKKKKF